MPDTPPAHLEALNAAQRAAAEHGLSGERADDPRPLLIIAGAGSGKTNTLAHRVAHLVHTGADPRRILLLTFTRRAAAEMTRRAHAILARAARPLAAAREHFDATERHGSPVPAATTTASAGRAPSMPSRIACCACTPRAWGSTRASRCSTARTRRT